MIDCVDNGFLRTLFINRPDKANSLTGDMLTDLHNYVQTAHDKKVLVLTGVGKVFSAGMDLEHAKDGLALSPIWEDLSHAISDFKGFTICAFNGTVAGGAIGMTLACDIRFAVSSTKIFYPVMKLGFLPQPSDPRRMAELIGPARTKLILMGGRKIDAGTAVDWGLLDDVFPDQQALEIAVADITQDALSAEMTHINAIKELIPPKNGSHTINRPKST